MTDRLQGNIVNGAEVVVAHLKEFGVDHIFGLPGVHNLPIYDALRDVPSIRVITTRNESAASFMSQGYSRTARRVAVCLLAPGPGVTNALTGIAEAFVDSTPMLVISGGIKQSSAGKGAIHDTDQMVLLSPVTKWRRRITKFEDIRPAIRRAFIEASSKRTRPAFIEIPLDIQSAKGRAPKASPLRIRRVSCSFEKVGTVADVLSKAKRPVIIAGGGVLNANAVLELQALSESTGIQVATTISAKEAMPDSSPLSLGLLNDEVARKALPEADVILSLGCRFAERSTCAWTLPIKGKLIQVDVDPTEIARNYPVVSGILCDVRLFLANLIELVGDVKVERDEHFARKAEELKAKRAERYEEKLSSQAVPLKPQHVMRELGNILREGTMVSCDSGNNAWWPMMFLESTPNRRFLFPSGNVSMGFGFPAALGARCVSRRVVCITGDGGFMMQLAELATSIQEKLNVTVILLNDGGFGAIRHYQRHNFEARYVGVDLQNPDFARLAESFGAKGITVRTPSELTSGLHEASYSNKTTVLDVKIDPEEVALPEWILRSFCGEIGET